MAAAPGFAIADWLNQPWLRQKNSWYYGRQDVFEVAAAYAFHLAEAQGFIDGNKRTGVASALVFLALNGEYEQPHQLELYLAMIAVAEKRQSKTDLAEIFRRSKDSRGDIHDDGC